MDRRQAEVEDLADRRWVEEVPVMVDRRQDRAMEEGRRWVDHQVPAMEVHQVPAMEALDTERYCEALVMSVLL